MVDNEQTTLYVDFQHIVQKDIELAEAIETYYYRLDQYLRKAVQATVKKQSPHFVTDERGDREFWVSFYNHTAVYK